MDAKNRPFIGSVKLIFSKQKTMGVQLMTGQMILTKQLLQSLQHHLQGCLHMNELCCFRASGRAQRYNDLPLPQQPCSNHWRSTQIHDGSIPLAWFIAGSRKYSRNWHGIWNRLAALGELLIYEKEIASSNSKEFICKAFWNYVIMWYYVYIRFDIRWPSTYSWQSSTEIRKLSFTLRPFAMDFLDFASLWS